MAAPGNRDQLGADEIHAEVEELLLGKPLSRQGQLQDRHAGSVVGDDQRRRRARRQLPQLRLRNGRDLRDRLVNVRVRLEKDLDDRDAVQRLRLDVLDVVHRGGQVAFVQESQCGLTSPARSGRGSSR